MSIEQYYNEVVTGNRYDLEGASKHNQEMITAKVKASDMPLIEKRFISQNHNGC